MLDLLQRLFHYIKKEKAIIAIGSIAFLIHIIFAVPFVHDWDGYVFTESAKSMLHGITPYQTVEKNDPSIYPDSDQIMTEQWYGYPPLPLLIFTTSYGLFHLFISQMNPIIENIAIKVPFILGDFLCALLIYTYLKPSNEKNARRAAVLILLNPLLIWISAAWGMFDIWMVNFYLLFLLMLRKANTIIKTIASGIFLALSIQIKLFVLFFLPVSLFYTVNILKKKNDRIYFFAAFTLTTLLIDIPFFLSSPQGFMNQNLIMHLARPPQGVGIVAIVDYISRIYDISVSYFPIIMNVTGILLIVFFTSASFFLIKKKENNLLLSVSVIYMTTLLFNKVVNEQYFVVIIALFIILTHTHQVIFHAISKKLMKWTEIYATCVILFAAVILGFHFLTFLPSFISDTLLKASTNYLVFFLSKSFPGIPRYTYPDSLFTWYHLPGTITYILLIPLYGLFLFSLFTYAKNQLYQLKKIHITFLSLRLPIVKKNTIISIVVSIFFLIILIKPITGYLQAKHAFALVDLINPNQKVSFQKNPKVGVFYYTWWNNPSHNSNIRDDAWTLTTLTPKDGYYTSKNSFFVKHIKQMKSAGIDFAVLSYHLYDRRKYITFGQYASKLGLYYSPMIETFDILGFNQFRPVDNSGQKLLGYSLNDVSKNALENIIESSLANDVSKKAFLFINKKPVVFIFFSHWFYPSWDIAYKKKLCEKILHKYQSNKGNPFRILSKIWNVRINNFDEIIANFPQDIEGFNQPDKISTDFKEAFLDDYNSFWTTIKQDIEKNSGPITLIGTYPEYSQNITKEKVVLDADIIKTNVFDGEFFYGISSTWYAWRNITDNIETIKTKWEDQMKNQTERNRTRSWPVMLSVVPAYNEKYVRAYNPFEPIGPIINGVNTYDWTWQTAIQNIPDYILITSWNEFFEGTAIEPTKENNNTFIKQTRFWTNKLKSDHALRL